MPRPFTLVERVATPEGPLELRQRSERDFMITIGTRVLMSSIIHRSEVLVGQWGCEPIRGRTAPRVLIGGLGIGYTLRAALDILPQRAIVHVAELNAVVERWCRGPLAILTQDALADRRVHVEIADLMAPVRRAAAGPKNERYDAIVIDLYVGPSDQDKPSHPLYGAEALRRTEGALAEQGVYAVWSEEPSPLFEHRLKRLGFDVEWKRNQGGGPRHAVCVAKKRASAR